jgi:hypothetical protein
VFGLWAVFNPASALALTAAIGVMNYCWTTMTQPIRSVNDFATRDAKAAGLVAWLYSLGVTWYTTSAVGVEWDNDGTRMAAFLSCAVGATLSAKLVYWIGYGETLALMTGWRYFGISAALFVIGTTLIEQSRQGTEMTLVQLLAALASLLPAAVPTVYNFVLMTVFIGRHCIIRPCVWIRAVLAANGAAHDRDAFYTARVIGEAAEYFQEAAEYFQEEAEFVQVAEPVQAKKRRTRAAVTMPDVGNQPHACRRQSARLAEKNHA